MNKKLLRVSFLFGFVISSPGFGQPSARPFAMSSTALQTIPGTNAVSANGSSSFSFSDLANDVDLISVFPEYLGIPFPSFQDASGPDANDPWAIQMTALANAAKAPGKPIFLHLTFARISLVPLAINVNGTSQPIAGWAANCTNFLIPTYSVLGPAYVNYVIWMTKLFQPKYLVTMTEINLYYVNCGGNTPSWQALKVFAQASYVAAKLTNPSVIAFPTFNLESLYNSKIDGYDQQQYSDLSDLSRDRLGLATYPWWLVNPYKIPPDYLTRIRDKNPTEPPVVIAETGWNSSQISLYVAFIDKCVQPFGFYSDPSFETAYMSFVFYSAFNNNFDVIVWWSDRDLILSDVMTTCYPAASKPNYPECNGDPWCVTENTYRTSQGGLFGELLLKGFGTMGLRDYSGHPKDGQMSLWNQYLKLPIMSLIPGSQN